MNNVHLFLIRETREGEILIITNANLFTRDDLAGLIKERSNPKLIIGYIYKFKVFKFSSILFFYININLRFLSLKILNLYI